MYVWSNPPPALLRAEVAPHAEFAVFQALASPRLEVLDVRVERLGDDTWRIQAGLANTGWLPTDVTRWARKHHMVLPVTAEISGDLTVVSGAAKVQLGQLEGRIALRVNGWTQNDGTAERTTASWVVRAAAGTSVTVDAVHPRAGAARRTVNLA
jgi:hypothetical protein